MQDIPKGPTGIQRVIVGHCVRNEVYTTIRHDQNPRAIDEQTRVLLRESDKPLTRMTDASQTKTLACEAFFFAYQRSFCFRSRRFYTASPLAMLAFSRMDTPHVTSPSFPIENITLAKLALLSLMHAQIPHLNKENLFAISHHGRSCSPSCCTPKHDRTSCY